MRERDVERKLIKAVEWEGGLCLKFTPQGVAGYPDRLVLLPGGLFAFIEVKRPGGTMRPLQVARHTKLRSLGLQVYLLNDENQIEGIINNIKKAR